MTSKKKCYICGGNATKIFQSYTKKLPHYYCEKHFKIFIKKRTDKEGQ